MVENFVDQSSDSSELEIYTEFMKWLEEAKTSFSLWFDRQTKSKVVTTATAYISHFLRFCSKAIPLPSSRLHLRYEDCLEVWRENYQNCPLLYYVRQLCTIIYTHM